MEEILGSVFKTAAILLMADIIYIGKKVGPLAVAWFKSKLSIDQEQKLDKLVYELTAAADQMYKADDPEGTIRYEYVMEALEDAGYKITNAIIAKVESYVFHLPRSGGAA